MSRTPKLKLGENEKLSFHTVSSEKCRNSDYRQFFFVLVRVIFVDRVLLPQKNDPLNYTN